MSLRETFTGLFGGKGEEEPKVEPSEVDVNETLKEDASTEESSGETTTEETPSTEEKAE
ncbi:MAG: hypothetical protein AAB969_04400 [Patescibacteria group bacterium]